MTDQGDGAWFRRRTRGLGYNMVPVTWQGWVMILVFVVILLATAFSGDPNTARPASVPSLLKIKAAVGLSGTHLPVQVMLPLLAAEVGVFVLIVWWKSRALKPLD
jgi:hypothetical protein